MRTVFCHFEVILVGTKAQIDLTFTLIQSESGDSGVSVGVSGPTLSTHENATRAQSSWPTILMGINHN